MWCLYEIYLGLKAFRCLFTFNIITNRRGNRGFLLCDLCMTIIAKKSIGQLRQLYFRMKDEIFGKMRHGGMSYNTLGLEKLLREEFTEHMCMDDESYPKCVCVTCPRIYDCTK